LKWVLQSKFKILERVVSPAPSSSDWKFTWVASLITGMSAMDNGR